MESIINTLDYIGYQGPIINSLVTLFSLLDRPSYLFMFMLGSILNYELNNQLKIIIKEPRPIHPLPYIDDHLIRGRQLYGMPSAHAQIVSFTTNYLILIKTHPYFIFFCLFIGMLTLIQRWKYRKHSVQQLIAGVLVGWFFSYFIYWITIIYLQNIKNTD